MATGAGGGAARWAVCAALAAAAAASPARQAEDRSFRRHPAAGAVHMLEPADTNGNVGVMAGPDGVLLVDSHFRASAASLMAEVAKISDREIRFLVNTHVHPDHIGGNAPLADRGVVIVAHETVRLAMLSRIRIPRRGGVYFPAPPAEARPAITYTDAISIHLNGEEVRVLRAPPAHTGGDSFVHFTGSDVLHLGDVFRTNMYPIVDRSNGGSFLGMIEAMRLAIGLAGPDTRVIPGHGRAVSDRAGMEEYLALLLALRDRVRALIDRGLTLEQALAERPTRDLDARWGGVPSWTAADLLTVVYEELAAS